MKKKNFITFSSMQSITALPFNRGSSVLMGIIPHYMLCSVYLSPMLFLKNIILYCHIRGNIHFVSYLLNKFV